MEDEISHSGVQMVVQTGENGISTGKLGRTNSVTDAVAKYTLATGKVCFWYQTNRGQVFPSCFFNVVLADMNILTR